MTYLKRVVFFSLFLAFFGCSRQFHAAKLIPGESIIEDAISSLGEPISIKNKGADEQVLIWRDITVQAKASVISVVQRKPAYYESTLQFWRQHYKASKQDFSKVHASNYTSEHLWQLHLPQQKINIIYDETKDEVVKVMYYHVE